MTQNNTMPVRNTAVAATIPTFEEVYAMDYVQESLRALVMANSRKYPMMAAYEDDIKQEMLIFLAQALPKFDPQKSQIKTFCRKMLVCGLSHARRYYFSDTQVHLSQAVQIEKLMECQQEEMDMSVSTEIRNATEAYSVNPFENAAFKEEFYRLFNQLSAKDKKIAEAVMDGQTFKDIWTSGMCSHRYLYSHALPTMKKLFSIFFQNSSKKRY